MTQPPPQPGYPPQQPAGQAPNNYLVWSILATLFCFPITGIVAIVKAASVNGLWAQGLYAEAQAASASARKWVIWSVIIWAVWVVVVIIISVAGGMSADNSSMAMLSPLL
ncbi:CD225/dispanin family protein [Mycobacterium sp. 852002-51057_SCH5723018]|uniref:CD225/dispanin family protein n=1 Tax=Mycobacterium sp. 852002-51057_SCH5723018 TaxID=1834094 RepID=UPI0009EE3067|nr:CD225/dispanin family protein [Mycobacterium sp. 852002-51057_SCH5723018]